MNDKSDFIVVGNWTTLDNCRATQSKTVLARPVSASAIQTSAVRVQYCTGSYLSLTPHSYRPTWKAIRFEILLYVVFTLG